MTKTEFISQIKPVLKEMGYRKTRNYWHQDSGELIRCIFVQGSQWNRENYYVEVGWALPDPERRKPTQPDWYARGRIGQTDPPLEALLAFLQGPAAEIDSRPALLQYLGKTRCTRILNQFHFDPI